MPDPLREQIWTTAKARLVAISLANGYRTDVRRVTRRLEFLDTTPELPILLLLPAYELDEEAYEEATLEGKVEAHMGMEVRAYAEGTDALEPATALENLEADIAKALLTPTITLGLDFVVDVRRGRRDGDDLPLDSGTYRAWRSIFYVVHYTYTEGEE